jgi:hypothetical protein
MLCTSHPPCNPVARQGQCWLYEMQQRPPSCTTLLTASCSLSGDPAAHSHGPFCNKLGVTRMQPPGLTHFDKLWEDGQTAYASESPAGRLAMLAWLDPPARDAASMAGPAAGQPRRPSAAPAQSSQQQQQQPPAAAAAPPAAAMPVRAARRESVLPAAPPQLAAEGQQRAAAAAEPAAAAAADRMAQLLMVRSGCLCSVFIGGDQLSCLLWCHDLQCSSAAVMAGAASSGSPLRSSRRKRMLPIQPPRVPSRRARRPRKKQKRRPGERPKQLRPRLQMPHQRRPLRSSPSIDMQPPEAGPNAARKHCPRQIPPQAPERSSAMRPTTAGSCVP